MRRIKNPKPYLERSTDTWDQIWTRRKRRLERGFSLEIGVKIREQESALFLWCVLQVGNISQHPKYHVFFEFSPAEQRWFSFSYYVAQYNFCEVWEELNLETSCSGLFVGFHIFARYSWLYVVFMQTYFGASPLVVSYNFAFLCQNIFLGYLWILAIPAYFQA